MCVCVWVGWLGLGQGGGGKVEGESAWAKKERDVQLCVIVALLELHACLFSIAWQPVVSLIVLYGHCVLQCTVNLTAPSLLLNCGCKGVFGSVVRVWVGELG